MSEIALISARKNRLETAAKKGNTNAKVALDLANSPNKFLSTVQIGITLIGILTGIYSGDKITHDVQAFVAGFEVLKPYSESIGVGIVVVVLTFFSLVLGELLPKRIGLNHPEGIAKAVAVPMKIVSKVTTPFIWLLTISTEFLLKLLQIKPTADGKVTEEEIESFLDLGKDSGTLEEDDHERLKNTLEFSDTLVEEIMVPRVKIDALSDQVTIEESLEYYLTHTHSRIPVYHEQIDNIV